MIKGTIHQEFITILYQYPSNIDSEYRQWSMTELHEEIEKSTSDLEEVRGREMCTLSLRPSSFSLGYLLMIIHNILIHISPEPEKGQCSPINRWTDKPCIFINGKLLQNEKEVTTDPFILIIQQYHSE